MQNHNKHNALNELAAQNDESAIWNVLDFFKIAKNWLAGGAVMGLLGAVGFVIVAPTQYEAMAVIQPATVGLPTTMKGAEVEPAALTLERLKIATFFTPDLVQACEANSAQHLAKAFKASLVKGNSLIQLSYRAASKGQAEACVNEVVARLVSTQAKIASPLIKTLEEQLALTQRRLADDKAYQAQVAQRSSAGDGASLLMLKSVLQREELAQLQKMALDQSIQLSAPLTQPMQLLEPVYAPEKAVFPKPLPSVLIGALAGLVLGGLAFFVRRSWLARQAS